MSHKWPPTQPHSGSPATERDALNPQHKILVTYKDGTQRVKSYASAAEAMEAHQWIVSHPNVEDVEAV